LMYTVNSTQLHLVLFGSIPMSEFVRKPYQRTRTVLLLFCEHTKVFIDLNTIQGKFTSDRCYDHCIVARLFTNANHTLKVVLIYVASPRKDVVSIR